MDNPGTLASIIESLAGSGPVALVLFYWIRSERIEKRELQTKLIEVLEKYAGIGEATHDALRQILHLSGDDHHAQQRQEAAYKDTERSD